MTWEIAILFLSSLFCLYYAFFILSARKGLLRIEITPISSHSPSVSVLIAARNEQETIAHCLNAVLDQDYPRDRMEVILIDDGSTDTSAAIANAIRNATGKRFYNLPINLEELLLRRKLFPKDLKRGSS